MNQRLKKWTALKLRKLAHRLDKQAPTTSWTGGRWLRITMSSVTMPPGSSPALKTSMLVSAISTVSSSPKPPRDERSFATDEGRAPFTVRRLEYLIPPAGHLILQTMRSHDQYNTTFYGLDDRYRGISGGRRVILINPADLEGAGVEDRQLVDVISVFNGEERRAEKFRMVGYPTAKGCVTAYFPEANALVHRDLVARESNTPGFKAVMVRFESRADDRDEVPAAASVSQIREPIVPRRRRRR